MLVIPHPRVTVVNHLPPPTSGGSVSDAPAKHSKGWLDCFGSPGEIGRASCRKGWRCWWLAEESAEVVDDLEAHLPMVMVVIHLRTGLFVTWYLARHETTCHVA